MQRDNSRVVAQSSGRFAMIRTSTRAVSFLVIVLAQLQLYSSVGRCHSFEIQQKSWNYKSKYDVGYEVATKKNASIESTGVTSKSSGDNNTSNNNEPILLLNGFGVGSFHQHRLIHELFASGDENEGNDAAAAAAASERTVFCMDYLGQGRSWPRDCQDGLGENEMDLQYSADT
jgi:pimeloyl-ACP methyl ester carboxylesterase